MHQPTAGIFPPLLPAAFGLPQKPLRVARHGEGLIHQSWLAEYASSGAPRRFLHQAINQDVFGQPLQVMENIQLVSQHLQNQEPPPFPELLRILPTTSGSLLWEDATGVTWRTFHYVEDSITLQQVTQPRQAFLAGQAYGRFIKALQGLPADSLHTTIPRFHDTPWRWRQFTTACQSAIPSRRDQAQAESEFAHAHQAVAELLTPAIEQGQLQPCIVHNDTKLNNLLFHRVSGTPLCVVDLDTVMPGYALLDFGDLARNCLASTGIDLAVFRALLQGFMDGCGRLLGATEIRLLPLSVKLLAFELGLRFLTDYLQGDRYFPARHPQQNLQRCRKQFQLVQSLLEQESELLDCLNAPAGQAG